MVKILHTIIQSLVYQIYSVKNWIDMKELFGVIIAVAFVIFSIRQIINFESESSLIELIVYLITTVFFTGLLIYYIVKKIKS